MKDKNSSSLFAYVCFDIISIFISWALSFYIRFYLFPEAESGLLPLFALLAPVVILIEIYFANKYQLYRFQSLKSWHLNVASLIKAQTRSILIIIAIFYFIFPNKITRIGILLFYILCIIITLVSRIIVQNIVFSVRKRRGSFRRILLIGHGENILKFVSQNRNNPNSLLDFKGWFLDNESNTFDIPHVKGDLDSLLKQDKFDMIIIGFPADKGKDLDRILALCYDKFIPVMILPTLTYSYLNNHMEDYKGVPTIYMNHFHHSLMDRVSKRSFDIATSLFGLIVFSPVFLIVSLLVKMTSKGPIFFGQTRMGRDGTTFTIWKFRSMRVDAEERSGAVWAKKNDPRKTPIGGFLRATSLDEIPQFWNILKGEMSLVGPRPERPELIEDFKHEIPGYMLRHKMKCGLTGWAQVNGWRGNTSLEKRIEYDLYYIKNWSFILDIKIVLLTFLKGFINKNAY